MIHGQNKYEDIQTPEMRLKYLELVEKGEIFAEDREKYARYERLEASGFYNDIERSQIKIKNYKDVISSYVNLLEKNHDPDVLDEFSKLATKFNHTSKRVDNT